MASTSTRASRNPSTTRPGTSPASWGPGAAESSAGTVVSASRRGDWPAFFPDELAARLRDIGPENIHTLVLWTKDPRPILSSAPLLEVIRRLESLYLHWTVTGLGGTPLEPGVPPWEEALSFLPRLLAGLPLAGEAVCLRYDPLVDLAAAGGCLAGNMDAGLFESVASRAAAHGVATVRTSVMTVYPKVRKRLEARGYILDERALREKGEAFIAGVMRPVCAGLGLDLLTCANPDLGHRGCIDAGLLGRLHPRRLPCDPRKDRSQRGSCRCTRSLDIGQYRGCPHGCLYCYGNPLSSVAADGARGKRGATPCP